MGDRSSIEWTDATWNPVRGCSRVSEGCRHCYAESVAARFSGPGMAYEGLAKRVGGEARWTGKVRLVPEHLGDPLRWKRPRRVFVNSMSDLFHEALAFEEIAAVFGVMAAAPQHTFQVLTKRPARALAFFEWISLQPVSLGGPTVNAARGVKWYAWHHIDALRVHDPATPWVWPLPNVWLGVSVEDQATAGERIPELLQCPAAVRFVSYEPALGPVDFTDLIFHDGRPGVQHIDALRCDVDVEDDEPFYGATVDWIIVGGESGPGARPFDVAWARSTVAQCREAGVACFVKQLGARPVDPGRWPNREHLLGTEACGLQLRDRKGGDPSEWPEDLRVREFPGGATA